MHRRSLLIGVPAAGLAVAAAAALGVDEGVLPGRAWLRGRLGLLGPDGQIPDVPIGPVTTGSFASAARGGTTTGWTLVRPPGVHGRLPLVVALHGRGGDHTSIVDELGVPQYLAQAVADGVPPFAVAAVHGGDTYWHPHDGTDSGAMVVDELLPLLAAHGVRTGRVGLYGWSMGGYGALRLAGILGHSRAAGVAVASPAIWVDSSGVSGAGFSSAAEYDEYSVFGRQADLTGIPVRIDIGTDDPFYPAVKQYVAGFPPSAGVESTFTEGGHTDGFWRRMLPAELAFLGGSLDA